MANQAFIGTSVSVGAAGDGKSKGVASASAIILAPDDSVVAVTSGSALFGYSDPLESIRQGIADSIRTNVEDPSLVCYFLDTAAQLDSTRKY